MIRERSNFNSQLLFFVVDNRMACYIHATGWINVIFTILITVGGENEATVIQLDKEFAIWRKGLKFAKLRPNLKITQEKKRWTGIAYERYRNVTVLSCSRPVVSIGVSVDATAGMIILAVEVVVSKARQVVLCSFQYR